MSSIFNGKLIEIFHIDLIFQMMKLRLSLLLILVFAAYTQHQDPLRDVKYLQGLNIDSQLVSDTNSYITSLGYVLNNNFVCDGGNTVLGFGLANYLNWQGASIGKMAIYNAALRVQSAMNEVKRTLANNNAVIGNGNYVRGKNNLVIGNHNVLSGENNWMFASNQQANSNDMLIVNQYEICLGRIQSILNDPKLAIRCLNKQEKQDYFNMFDPNAIKSQISSLVRVIL